MASFWSAFGIKSTLKDWGMWKGPILHLAPDRKSNTTQCMGYSRSGRPCRRRVKSGLYCGSHGSFSSSSSSLGRSYSSYSSNDYYSFSTQCMGTTRSGRQCRKRVRHGSFCNFHSGSAGSYSTRRTSYSYDPPVFSERVSYPDPKKCEADTPAGSCRYYAWNNGNFCSHHSAAESAGLPSHQEYREMENTLETAIAHQSAVSFVYHRGTSPGKKRSIIPEEIYKPGNGATYLKGHCLLRDAERNFNLTFLRSLKLEKSR